MGIRHNSNVVRLPNGVLHIAPDTIDEALLSKALRDRLLTLENEVNNRSGGGDGEHGLFQQLTPSSVWTIDHNLGRHPAVTVQDINGEEIIADVQHTSLNQIVITHNTSITGYVAW